MPRVFPEDATDEAIKKKGPCSGLRDDLKLCVMNADCVKVDKRKVRDCFDTDDMPIECKQLRTLLFECKRSLLDNRLRFRGNKGQCCWRVV